MKASEAELRLMVDSWNAHWRAGTVVRVLLDDGSFRRTKTRSGAWLVPGPAAFVLVEGIGGGYNLLRVAPDWEEG